VCYSDNSCDMEFGVSSRIDCGTNVVGVSWTSLGPTEQANVLVTTTESRVAVYAAEDRRLVWSWLTRPGSYNRFTVAAVQNRLLRKFLCVQNDDRLFAWHEKDPSLETALKRKLPSDAYALRTSKRLRLSCVVYTDGGVGFVDDTLADIVASRGQQDGTITTWARLTKTPGDDSKFFLLVLKQAPVVDSSNLEPSALTIPEKTDKRSKKRNLAKSELTNPYLLVYVLSVKRGDSEELSYNLRLAATHHFPSPTTNSHPARIAAITLHKIARSLCLVWSDGTMQVLSFPVTASIWYSHAPREAFKRQLARFQPGLARGTSGRPENMYCSAFALEPSCMVLAGLEKNGDAFSIGLSVWDVRYGVVLAVRKIDIDTTTGPEEAVVAPNQIARRRSDSVATAASHGSGGSLLSSAQAVTRASLSPESIFQVLVSEDNAHIAVASRSRVILTDIAARGASLVSAINRMPQTRSFLTAGENEGAIDFGDSCSVDLKTTMPSMSTYAGPVMDLAPLLHDVRGESHADRCSVLLDLSSPASAAAGSEWAVSIAAAKGSCAADCLLIVDSCKTPTASSVLAVVAKYVQASQWMLAAADYAPREPSRGTKRARTESLATYHVHGPRSTRVVPTVPAPIVAAVSCRCAAEVKRALAMPSQVFDIEAVIKPLLAAGAVTASASFPLFTALADAAAERKSASHGEGRKASGKRGRSAMALSNPALQPQAALELLAELVSHVSDVPESFLVKLFLAGLHRIPARRLATLWRNATNHSGPHEEDCAVGLLYWTGLLVAAPRNDVFLEQALAALSVDDAAALLSCLLRLMEFHSSQDLSRLRTTSKVRVPSYGQVLDWVRMTFDAHFTRFILATKLSSTSGDASAALLNSALRDFVRLIRSESGVCELSASLRSQVLHMLGGGPMPLPPPSDHLVEFLRL
jgi:hypothetical protein